MENAVKNNYRWEAEWNEPDGTKIIKRVGGDLTGAIRFSLTPQIEGLPPHHFIGVPMKRRFCSGFIRLIDPNGIGDEYCHCVIMAECRIYVKSSDGSVIVVPPDFQLNL